MKIAIVYNRESQEVINLFGLPNREKYGLKTIAAIKDAIKQCGHQVKTFEGDKNIIRNLEEYMPAVLSGERPGLVFNLSYGIQGKARYTHIPSILEMVGIPYIGSDPLSQGLALDKVITKMILIQKGIPTPRYAILEKPDDLFLENLNYPLIVKPKNESVSYGLQIVNSEEELRSGAEVIYKMFGGATLVEEYIDGREINVGVLGNDPVRALPPLELIFKEGTKIFTYEDKSTKGASRIVKKCPAALTDSETEYIQSLAIATFKALGCNDSARIDFRIDKEGNPYVLEINSMASLSPGASYVMAAEKAGYDYKNLVEELISVASKRYFGESVNNGEADSLEVINEKNDIFEYFTKNRQKVENELKYWTNFSRDSDHPLGITKLMKALDGKFENLGLKHVDSFTNYNSAWAWETEAGYEGGVLLVIPTDYPPRPSDRIAEFRIEGGRIFGEGVGSTNAGMTCALESLKAIKTYSNINDKKIGVFAYTDESIGMRYSGKILNQMSKLAKEVIVLQPGTAGNKIVNQRRGLRKIKIVVERSPVSIGRKSNSTDIYFWTTEKINTIKEKIKNLDKFSVAVNDFKLQNNHMMLAHKITLTLCMTYVDSNLADEMEAEIKSMFKSTSKSIKSTVGTLEVRPPMNKNENQQELIMKLMNVYEDLQIPFGVDTKLFPSAGGDISEDVPVICGMSPATLELYNSEESILRLELLQKILIMTNFILSDE
ncbi:MAG: ATP-grasp domain-containing protein [Clostridiales bacterium]|nr:ATP-grasp domain-containing protein [Clostridiales bacterium]